MNRSIGPAVLLFAAIFAFSSPATAFCGFYVAGGDAKLFNEATQVVLMRHGNKTALSMQNNYQGPTEDFAMVVPVPQVLQKENVKTLEKAVFDKIDRLTAPRLVEYWERDPCFKPEPVEYEAVAESGAVPSSPTGGVKVEAKFQVGEYDVVVLSADESTSLDKYLRQEKYNIPDGAAPYFKPYIESGMYFFVAKVNKKKVKFENGRAVLSPLRFDYESEDFQLPIRLGMINSSGKQDLIVYVLAQGQRYEVANYENAFIPTNISVQNDVRERFGEFYRALFDRTVEKNKGAVITEYSWDASTCDPCPGPTLGPADYQTLGTDAVGANGGGWVITRLHARYGKDEIGEDLVFQAAEPVSGGREWRNEDGALVQGARPNSRNMFQGRYIIRHEWTGEVDCEDPQFGIWGGPNGSGQPRAGSAPSPNTEGRKPDFDAAAELELASLVKEAIPAVGVKPAEAAEPKEGSKAPGSEEPIQKEGPKSTCAGCSAANVPATPTGGLLVVIGALLLRRRRRKA
jgi:uncharacterized protein (TIGR03382 family)